MNKDQELLTETLQILVQIVDCLDDSITHLDRLRCRLKNYLSDKPPQKLTRSHKKNSQPKQL